MKLSIIPKAAPARFPYAEHRHMDAVMADEQSTVLAVHSFVADATFAADSCYRMADAGEVCSDPARPDHTLSRSAG